MARDALRMTLGVELSDAQLELVEQVAAQTQRPVQEIGLMVDAIGRGESVSEFVGMTPEVLNTIEQTATTLYRSKRYDEARNLFIGARLFGQMHQLVRPGAVRGIAACDHSQGYYLDAIELYREALQLEPGDLISKLALAECLCHTGQGPLGVSTAKEVVAAAQHDAKHAGLLVKARAIVAANGGRALPELGRRRKASALTLVPEAVAPNPERLAEQIFAGMEAQMQQQQAETPNELRAAQAAVHSFGTRPAGWVPPAGTEALFAEPDSIAMVDELALMVREKRLTIREIAQFTPAQMDAGYAIACRHVAMGEYVKAAQLVGWLSYIDSHDHRFYRLMGLCMQNLKLWGTADYFYDLTRIWLGNKACPTTDIYQGETALMMGEPERAAELLSRGVKAIRGKAAFAALDARATALLKQLAANPFEHSEPQTDTMQRRAQ